MGFWDEFLVNPPSEITFETEGEEAESHVTLWRGYQEFDDEELWDFGSGRTWRVSPPPQPSFPEYGGTTLCGLSIQSGHSMRSVAWGAFYDLDATGDPDQAVYDLHSISCMVCRRKLMYGVSQIIRRLTFLRDSVGRRYVEESPLVHGKEVLDSWSEGSSSGEYHRHVCSAASDEICPILVDIAAESERITCPECLAKIAADLAADGG